MLLSGGDALLVSDEKLEYIISRLRAIPHVEIIRIGSRTPVVLPQRITPELVNMLKKYHPDLAEHPLQSSERSDPESKQACSTSGRRRYSLGNQSVLLRGVNDCTHIMKKLVHELVKMRVRPYYIYICDLSLGIGHFRTPVSKGIEIIENLRGHTSGYAVPTFVVDAPGGGGKIPVMPNYVISQAPEPRGTPQLRRRNHDLYGTDRLQGRMPLRRVRESTSEGRRGRVVERRTSFARAVELSRKTRNHNL